MFGALRQHYAILSVAAMANVIPFTLAVPRVAAAIVDGGTINIPQDDYQSDGTANKIWTTNDNEGATGVDSPIWHRNLVGIVGSGHKAIGIQNNGAAGVGGLVLHFHSDRNINAFTWQARQIFATAGDTNTDSFFVGWTTNLQPGFGAGGINPSAYTAVAALTKTGVFNKTWDDASFSVTGISSQDVYIFIGRNDLNQGPGETHNVYFNMTSSFDPDTRDRSFFQVDASSPVPEPVSPSLMVFGGLMMLCRRR